MTQGPAEAHPRVGSRSLRPDREGLVLAVILHYGRVEPTARLHRQLLQGDPDKAGRILVLDNHAPEPYPEAWRRLPANLYWAGAFAYAAGEAENLGATHLWFLNNDLTFQSAPPHLGRAEARLAALEKRLGRVGLYAPAMERNPYHPQMRRRPGGEFRLVRIVDGVAPLVNLDCLRDAGGLDAADNPMGYGVDLMLSLRAAERGWPLVVDHRLVIRHQGHAAAKAAPGFMERAAAAERDYLSARLGPDFRAVIEAAKADFSDHDSLSPRRGPASAVARRHGD